MKQNGNFMCISPHFNVNKYCICGTSMNLCPSSPFLSESVAFSGKNVTLLADYVTILAGELQLFSFCVLFWKPLCHHL